MKGTIVVMPALNEERTIRDLSIQILKQAIDRLIVVDDGSTDRTREALDGLGVDVLVNSDNQGKGSSLLRGIDHALGLGCQRIVTIDADGQHDPSDIAALVAMSRQWPQDIIIGARTRERESAPPLRRFANGFADFWISWASGRPVTDTQSGLRLYPAELFRQTSIKPRIGHGFVFESEVLIDASTLGFESRAVPITARYNSDGRESHYRPITDTWSIVHMVAAKLLRRGMDPFALLRSLGVQIPKSTKDPASTRAVR